MNIWEAFDLTASLRDAGELAGCSPNTMGHYVAARAAGRLVPGRPAARPSVIDEFLPKLEELVERSRGKVRADVAPFAYSATHFQLQKVSSTSLECAGWSSSPGQRVVATVTTQPRRSASSASVKVPH